jgi:hypothetical protein
MEIFNKKEFIDKLKNQKEKVLNLCKNFPVYK